MIKSQIVQIWTTSLNTALNCAYDTKLTISISGCGNLSFKSQPLLQMWLWSPNWKIISDKILKILILNYRYSTVVVLLIV